MPPMWSSPYNPVDMCSCQRNVSTDICHQTPALSPSKRISRSLVPVPPPSGSAWIQACRPRVMKRSIWWVLPVGFLWDTKKKPGKTYQFNQHKKRVPSGDDIYQFKQIKGSNKSTIKCKSFFLGGSSRKKKRPLKFAGGVASGGALPCWKFI